MQQLIIDLALPAERYLAWYQGRAERVVMYSRDGRRVSLPAHHLRPFLTHGGVHSIWSACLSDSQIAACGC